jgi:opacity protein-like surface antigen
MNKVCDVLLLGLSMLLLTVTSSSAESKYNEVQPSSAYPYVDSYKAAPAPAPAVSKYMPPRPVVPAPDSKYMPPPPVIIEGVTYKPGWYLRGSIGHTSHNTSSDYIARTYIDSDDSNNPNAADRLNGSWVENSFSAGIGVGYHFSPSLRGDVTADYRFETDLTARDGSKRTYQLTMESSVVLANLYYDFHTGSPFSPYVGAGIGVAFNSTTDYNTGDVNGSYKADGADTFSLAYAAMLGVNYHVTEFMGLDIGYRNLSYGDAETEIITETGGLDMKSLSSHEIRVGINYDF